MLKKKALVDVLAILMPGFHDMDAHVAEAKKHLSKDEEIEAIELLAAAFSIIKMLEHEHGDAIKEIAGDNWFSTTCKKANLIYDKAIASHSGEEEGLFITHAAGRPTIKELMDLDCRTHFMPNVLEAITSLTKAVYQLEKATVPVPA